MGAFPTLGFYLAMTSMSMIDPGHVLRDFSAGRPGATETSTVVPIGSYQFEAGWTHSKRKNGNLMVRRGITDRIEVRFSLDDWRGNFNPSYGDLMAGVLYQMAKDDQKSQETALLITMTLPNGNEGISYDNALYNLIGCFSKSLTDVISCGFNIGMLFHSTQNVISSEYIYATTLGYELSEKVGVFVETYGGTPTNDLGELAHSFDGGVMYLIRDRIQIDINGGFKLTENGEDAFLGAGIAFRLPY